MVMGSILGSNPSDAGGTKSEAGLRVNQQRML